MNKREMLFYALLIALTFLVTAFMVHRVMNASYKRYQYMRECLKQANLNECEYYYSGSDL